MAKLWQKNYELNKLIERFTVGDDYLLDTQLLVADCVASVAHAQMLAEIKILSPQEFESLKKELLNLMDLFQSGNFTIQPSDEDCHTAIENYLVAKLGDVGKKIHTARSRNDQVIAALRLLSREYLFVIAEACCDLIKAILEFAQAHEFVPMAGRTHMQIAMPSSIGLWAGAWAEELLDAHMLLDTVYKLNDMCPLGSAASYGVPLPIKREMVSESLGFSRLQNNVLYVNNSRGKIEAIILDALSQLMLTMSKMAQDLIVFSMPEFAYFNIPAELCSGSSIMPQKKNPCGLELVRAKTATVLNCASTVKDIIKALPSGYNRDFQETKGPFLRGLELTLFSLRVLELTFQKLSVNEDKLREGFRTEIYATDEALSLVGQGIPFRDAYRQVGLNLAALKDRDPLEAIRQKKHTGATANLKLNQAFSLLTEVSNHWQELKTKIDSVYQKLLGRRPSFFRLGQLP